MQNIRENIWDGFNQDAPNIKFNAAKLLRLSMEYEEAPRNFTVACLRVLGYRCENITLDEVRILGEKATRLVNHTREKIRESLLMVQAGLIRPKAMSTNGLECNEHLGCKKIFFRRLIPNLSNNTPRKTDYDSDIFQLKGDRESCKRCLVFQNAYVTLLKFMLDEVVELRQ
ncbi:hypothetical protein B0J17DRAFT_719256 [Rhizoctonia solani]|nr:hypothetical protein B0J17DRAFT_719256 [Rhizoctonia solani]